MTELTPHDVAVAPEATADISVEHAARIAAVLDADLELGDGSALPLLWHFAFFAPAVPTAALGHDGHPRMAPGGPTADLPRRMWAGGRIEAHEPLLVGRPATRRSRVVQAERKSGRSGDLLVVTIEHEVEQGGRIVLTEEQDLVYRAAGATVEAPVGDHRPDVPDGGWCDPMTRDAVVLFRFSAITFNGHRIHYDLPYATAEEGYPGLVVHGPLTAVSLAESARRRGVVGRRFEFRATAPLFAALPFTLLGRPEGDAVALEAVRNDGAVAMTARLS